MILKLKSEGDCGLSHLIDHGSDLTRLNVDVPSGTPYTEIAGYLQETCLRVRTPADNSTVWLHIDSLSRALAESASTHDAHDSGCLSTTPACVGG